MLQNAPEGTRFLMPTPPPCATLSIHHPCVSDIKTLKELYNDIRTKLSCSRHHKPKTTVAFAGGSSVNLEMWLEVLPESEFFFTFNNVSFFKTASVQAAFRKCAERNINIFVAERELPFSNSVVPDTSGNGHHFCSVGRMLTESDCMVLGTGDDGHVSNITKTTESERCKFGPWKNNAGATFHDLLMYPKPIFILLDTKKYSKMYTDSVLNEALHETPLGQLTRNKDPPAEIMVFQNS